jgi:6-pyruvoyltetrahydropterin/6-carboxytetrahydropterin synthase
MASTLPSAWFNGLRVLFSRFRPRSESLPIPRPLPAIHPREVETEEPTRPTEFWLVDPALVVNPPPELCYRIAVDIFFNARHFVVIDGRAGPEHSHSYRLQVKCSSQVLALNDQVVIGYAQLRERMRLVVNAYNNQLLNALPPFQRLQPTTENLTGVLFQQLDRILFGLPVRLLEVTVWESPTEEITVTRLV